MLPRAQRGLPPVARRRGLAPPVTHLHTQATKRTPETTKSAGWPLSAPPIAVQTPTSLPGTPLLSIRRTIHPALPRDTGGEQHRGVPTELPQRPPAARSNTIGRSPVASSLPADSEVAGCPSRIPNPRHLDHFEQRAEHVRRQGDPRVALPEDRSVAARPSLAPRDPAMAHHEVADRLSRVDFSLLSNGYATREHRSPMPRRETSRQSASASGTRLSAWQIRSTSGCTTRPAGTSPTRSTSWCVSRVGQVWGNAEHSRSSLSGHGA
jgi:hypothetical protein